LTHIAIADSAAVVAAIAGTRIPRRAWSDVTDLAHVLAEARSILVAAREEAERLRCQAQAEGHQAGTASAQASAVGHILEAQQAARELLDASEKRIIALAVSIVARIAPTLGQAEWVAALAAEALRALRAERHVRVSVAPGAVEATRAALLQWQAAHPEVETAQVAADPDLEPFGCVIVSELGRVEAGLATQLGAVREGLAHLASQSREAPPPSQQPRSDEAPLP